MALFTATAATFAASISALAYLIYRALLPKPIPGIPCDPVSAGRLLGDIPDLLKAQKRRQEAFTFIAEKCIRLKSPVIQMFAQIGGKPWLIVADAREGIDIMTSRASEFDRSALFGGLFKATLPASQLLLPTNEEWRHHRRILADTLSPNFLESTSAPAIYSAVSDLLQLWRQKSRLALGRSFNVENDLIHAALDAIRAAAFGSPAGATQLQSSHIRNLDQVDLDMDSASTVEFLTAPLSAEVDAVGVLGDSSEITASSPFGSWAHQFTIWTYPSLRAAMKAKNTLIRSKIADATLKAERGQVPSSATDFAVAREIKDAARTDRKADLHSPVLRDKL
ncbi:Cytochrome P450 monooxygenase [Fulvia fulva]|uniref:Cytochrome P450 monooxygenase n=1 Tax=Passalora fulva TaxID=5499 RepID=A0A9Q8PMR9_PASFU|nr:Cytochrome P450 monooxygenase [Fulvia fulva]UJO25234.1 Cytochrome P450 monooxygenase [Fulvia fulva]